MTGFAQRYWRGRGVNRREFRWAIEQWSYFSITSWLDTSAAPGSTEPEMLLTSHFSVQGFLSANAGDVDPSTIMSAVIEPKTPIRPTFCFMPTADLPFLVTLQ